MSDKTKKTGAFNSLREFMDAIEASGLKKAPENFAPMNKDCLLDSFPDALNVVENKWAHMITAQRKNTTTDGL